MVAGWLGPATGRGVTAARFPTVRLDPSADLPHHARMPDVALLDGPVALPASGGAPRSLVILLHGYGSNGQDLIGLSPYWRPALPNTLFVAPDAPQPCPGAPGGRQWWALTNLTQQARADGVRQSAGVLNAFIDRQLDRHGLTDEQLALVGFSQGTMMALHVGPRRARALAGIVGYSGMLADPDALAVEVLTKPPVLLIHGDADPVLPVAALHQAEASLSALGFAVSARVSPGLQHSIDEAGLRLGQQFLSQVLGAA
jgi:phospholipase/carboxylesterase